jgi:hypothetical protein
MNAVLSSEVRRLGGDPADDVWRWFLLRGPHGESFTWSPAKSKPPGYVSFDHLRDIIAERASQDANFVSSVSAVTRVALTSNHVEMVRRGLQVAGAAALLEFVPRVKELTTDADPSVASDARACLFVLHRLAR